MTRKYRKLILRVGFFYLIIRLFLTAMYAKTNFAEAMLVKVSAPLDKLGMCSQSQNIINLFFCGLCVTSLRPLRLMDFKN
jgi:hypothetical protein